ncbi:hypothetical protein GCM10009550_58010 [Actinocorallia libanotica]|uniref:Uncharacterized protein n=1 Tax=Actinocorallia libanotica TaxID=46162 RepID=A0ABN1RSV8_9ACTN
MRAWQILDAGIATALAVQGPADEIEPVTCLTDQPIRTFIDQSTYSTLEATKGIYLKKTFF